MCVVLILHALHALVALQFLAQPLRQLPGQLREASVLLQPLVLRHTDVSHVPHEPAGQAEEDDQGAGVDQEVSVEAAVQAQVREDPDEEQHQADDVKGHGGQEEREAAADALDQVHAGGFQAAGAAGCFMVST